MALTSKQVIEHVANHIYNDIYGDIDHFQGIKDPKQASIAWARWISDGEGFTIHTPGHQDGWSVVHEHVTISEEDAGKAYDLAQSWAS